MFDSEEEEDSEALDMPKEETNANLPSSEELIKFYSQIIKEAVKNELKIPEEEEQFEDSHSSQFGISVKPFGALRTSVVEFLADIY